MERLAIKDLLDEAYDRYARPEFIAQDPIQVPRAFSLREDVEIMAFLTATIAWGQRRTIIQNAFRIAKLMDERPFDFVMNATARDLSRLDRFVHRTFNSTDLRHFVIALRHLYVEHGGPQEAFLDQGRWDDVASAIGRFRQRFFEPAHEPRTRKHVAYPSRGSNAKRINMFLRWMVRPDDRGIDLGLWKKIPASALHVPLDVHTGRVARELGLLERRQDDWKSVVELTGRLREFDPKDPIKYDIALFATGANDPRTVKPQRARLRRAVIIQ